MVLGRNTSVFDGYVAKHIDGVKVPKVSKKKAGNKGKIKKNLSLSHQQKITKVQSTICIA